MIKIQHEKTRIENDTVKLVNNVEALLEGAAKARIPSLQFQGEVWTSPFDTVMRTFEGSPEALLESDDLLPAMLDFNVIRFLQEEASVKETWNARMNKNGDAVSSTGSFHGDTPTDSSDYADKGGSSSSSSPEKDSGSLQEKNAS